MLLIVWISGCYNNLTLLLFFAFLLIEVILLCNIYYYVYKYISLLQHVATQIGISVNNYIYTITIYKNRLVFINRERI